MQMMRIATRNLIDSHEATTAFLKEGHAVEAMLAEHDVDLVSLGSTSNLDNAEHIVATIQACDKIHCTISLERGAMLGDVKRSAKCVLDIANATGIKLPLYYFLMQLKLLCFIKMVLYWLQASIATSVFLIKRMCKLENKGLNMAICIVVTTRWCRLLSFWCHCQLPGWYPLLSSCICS